MSAHTSQTPATDRTCREHTGAEDFWKRIGAEFGYLTADRAAALLDTTADQVPTLLLGIDRDDQIVYPAFQIDRANRAPWPVIARLRKLAAEYGYSDAGVVQWLCRRTTYLDDGEGFGALRPVDIILEHPGRVIAVASEAWGVVW